MKTEYNQPIRERKGWSTISADGQKESDSNSGPAGQSNRPMVSQEIGRWT
jgi:hypothetical protein